MKDYKSGFKMQIGSKQVNSPFAFNMKDTKNIADSPMMNLTSVDPGGGFDQMEDQYGDYYKKAMKSLENNLPDQNKAFMERAKSLQDPNDDDDNGDNRYSDADVYQSLGAGLKELLKPKKGTEAYARQQERKASRYLNRIKRGFGEESDEYKKQQKEVENKSKIIGTQTLVGDKLRKLFKKK